jgi:hypothetical protein
MKKRIYLDSGVLIAAFRGEGSLGLSAIKILDDIRMQPVLSDAVWLETMPKPLYENNREEIEFYNKILEYSEFIKINEQAILSAKDIAPKYGLSAMDALHIALAMESGADEIVTTEKPTKPLLRVKEMKVHTLNEI